MNFVKSYFIDASGRIVEADEALDSFGILKPGFSMRVPLELRDAMRAGASVDDAVRITREHVKSQALALVDAANKTAWMGREPQAGDNCLLDGKCAILVRDATGELVAQPLAAPTAMTATDADAIKRAAYDAYDEEAQNAWKHPTGLR